MSSSPFVGVFLGMIFLTTGLVTASVITETARNTASCTAKPAPRTTAIRAASAPSANHTETKAQVAASARTAVISTMIHKMYITLLTPFVVGTGVYVG